MVTRRSHGNSAAGGQLSLEMLMSARPYLLPSRPQRPLTQDPRTEAVSFLDMAPENRPVPDDTTGRDRPYH